MRALVILGFLFIVLAAATLPPDNVRAQSCFDDYVSVETVLGEVIEIRPAPEPFPTADILLSGPNPCERMWLQALKTDAERCRPGDRIQAKGYVTRDPEEASWGINSDKNSYMIFGQDFTCG
jgi:hypothetical protein